MSSVSMLCRLFICTLFLEEYYMIAYGQMTTGSPNQGVCMGDQAPANGQADCYNSGMTQFCNISCDTGYYFTGMDRETSSLLYTCSGGIWIPPTMPDCEAFDYCENVDCMYGGTCRDLAPGFICDCPPGYEGLYCGTDTDDCIGAPCKNNGSCTDRVNRYLCDCTELYAGHNCTIEKRTANSPLVTSLIPDYGPKAGGTRITLIGTNFLSPVRAVLLRSGSQEFECTVVYSTATTIVAVTPPGSDVFVGAVLAVSVEHAGSWTVLTSRTFMYRADPIFHSLYPQKTIQRGCTTITVRGDNLDSVISPVLEVTLDYSAMNKSSRRRLSTKPCCTDTNCTDEFPSKVIYCTTPAVEIPPEFLRGVQETPLLNYDTGARKLSFHIGIVFDGLVIYRNLSEFSWLEMFADLQVYRTPVLIEQNDVISFKSNERITIQGQNLDKGVPAGDYVVLIGESGICADLNISKSEITCLPPEDPPESSALNTNNSYMINVNIGCNTRIQYGHLAYSSQGLPSWLWPAIGALGGVIVIVVVVTVTVILCRRRGTTSGAGSSNDGNDGPGDADALEIMQEVFEQQKAKQQTHERQKSNRLSQINEYEMDLSTFLGPGEGEGGAEQLGRPAETYEALGAREGAMGSDIYTSPVIPQSSSKPQGGKRKSRSLVDKLNELVTYLRPKSRLSRMETHVEETDAYYEDDEDPYVNKEVAQAMAKRAKKRTTVIQGEERERSSHQISPSRQNSRHRVTSMFPEGEDPRLQRASARDSAHREDPEQEFYMNTLKSTKDL